MVAINVTQIVISSKNIGLIVLISSAYPSAPSQITTQASQITNAFHATKTASYAMARTRPIALNAIAHHI